jgi:two-component system LytT family response regulator
MSKPDYPERVLVEKRDKLNTISVEDIIWIEAYGDYSKLHTANDILVSNYGISALEEKFNPKTFLRMHRSSIINLNKVKKLHKYGKSYDITMINKEVVRVSRGYMDTIKKIIL